MIFILVMALATAALTWVAGWWGVAVVALVAGFLYSGSAGTSWRAAVAAVAGWCVLLGIDAASGAFGRVTSTVSGAMSIPAPALLVVTLLFAALLAWSTATIAAELGRLTSR